MDIYISPFGEQTSVLFNALKEGNHILCKNEGILFITENSWK